MTDAPSFISGHHLVIIEPHMRIFSGHPCRGGVQGNFTNDNKGLRVFPGQLEPFAVKEPIDFSKPYNGTIFRFPLRTDDQAKVSELSSTVYPVKRVIIKIATLSWLLLFENEKNTFNQITDCDRDHTFCC